MPNEELLDAYFRDACSEVELSEIKRLLREEEAFGRAFVDYAVETSQMIDVAGERVVGMVGARAPARMVAPWRAVLALAACAMLALGVIWQQSKGIAEPVASLANAVAAEWQGAMPTVLGGTLVAQRIGLKAGFAEFAFADGARLILEGPAELELLAGDRARLLSGRVVVRMEDGREGFVLETPAGEVVDLGTEFGVLVDGARETQVHVLSGAVELPEGDGGPRRLEESQAVSIVATESSMMAVTPDEFMRVLPPIEHPMPDYVHWSFDEFDGERLADEGRGIDGRRWDARPRALGRSAGPQFVDGMIGKALYFDGKGAFLETDFSGVGKGDSRTVAFWVKVPEDAGLTEAYAMLGWGSFKYKGATWQISWNCEPSDGPLGRLRAGVHGGQVIGTRDLRDGRWHHVAIVLFGGESADVATHVMLYVDGELEPSSRKAVRAVRTDLATGAKNVQVGRNASKDSERQFFRGWLDDMVISNEPLSPRQIRRVMKEGGGSLRRVDGSL